MADQDYDTREIGMRLKGGLAEAGVSREELASRVGVSKWTVDQWVLGHVRMKLIDAAKVCDVLGKSLYWLLGRQAA